MTYEMECEDFLRLKDAEIAALNEEISVLRIRLERSQRDAADKAEWQERSQRLLTALDEALARERARERARNDLRRQEQEAEL